jgi:hypothetical protein
MFPANEAVILRGTAKYAKLTGLDQYGKWSCCIYPDEESMQKIHKLKSEGVRNDLRHDDDGYCVTFSRPAVIKTKAKGDIPLDPVKVYDHEDHTLDGGYVEDGADITMKLETYGGKSPTGYGTYKAARLVAIKVHGVKPTRPIPL